MLKFLKYAVIYYMKGRAQDSKSFATFEDAQAFATALNLNPECECYHIQLPKR